MNIKTIMCISKMLNEKYEDAEAKCEEIYECIEAYTSAPQEQRDDAKNEAAFKELQQKLIQARAERDELRMICADFERTDWH